MQKFLLFTCMLFVAPAGATTENKIDVITTPYKPSFIIQHEPVLNTLQAATLGGAAFTSVQRFLGKGRPKTALAASVSTFLISYLFHPFTIQTSHADALIMQQEQARSRASQVWHGFWEVLEKPILDNAQIDTREALRIIRNLAEQGEKYCPYFMLRECTRESNTICTLSRSWDPQYRHTFENEIISSLLAKWASGTAPIHYVGFGSGGMYQDFVTIARALSQKPDAALVIHLIDQQYAPFEYSRSHLKTHREILTNYNTDLEPAMKTLLAEAGLAGSAEEQSKRIQTITLLHELSYQQFIGYLQKTFPQAKLSLHAHASVASYLSYIKQYNMPSADIVAAADIQDDQKSKLLYLALCVKTLESKPDSYNLLLAKVADRAVLASFSCKETPNAKKLIPFADQGEIFCLERSIKPSRAIFAFLDTFQ